MSLQPSATATSFSGSEDEDLSPVPLTRHDRSNTINYKVPMATDLVVPYEEGTESERKADEDIKTVPLAGRRSEGDVTLTLPERSKESSSSPPVSSNDDTNATSATAPVSVSVSSNGSDKQATPTTPEGTAGKSVNEQKTNLVSPSSDSISMSETSPASQTRDSLTVSPSKERRRRKSRSPTSSRRTSLRRPAPRPVADTYRTWEGYLYKKTSGVLKKYQQKWCYVLERYLYYFNEGSVRPRGAIDLTRAQVLIPEDDDEEKVRIDVRWGPRLFRFKAECTEIRDECFSVLQYNHESARAILDDDADRSCYRVSLPSSGKKFWRVVDQQADKEREWSTIKAEDVGKVCKTGDLILFQTAGVKGGFIRTATRAKYDHVGMILKFKEGQVGVLETLANTGCQITNFEGFIKEKWHKQYSAIVIRHLHTKLNKEMGQKIEEFVRKVDGRSYKWSFGKAMRSQSVLEFDNEEKTFFCSELVAAAYKHMGLLRDSVASSKYVPGSFAEKHNLLLMKGASLGSEELVVFEEDEEEEEMERNGKNKNGAKNNAEESTDVCSHIDEPSEEALPPSSSSCASSSSSAVGAGAAAGHGGKKGTKMTPSEEKRDADAVSSVCDEGRKST